MSFFTKIKNWLGIGGVKVSLDVPGQVSKSDTKIDGKVILTTKSEQKILDMNVKVIEKWETKKGDVKKTKTIQLGQVKVPCNFAIKPGETKEVKFSAPFKVVKSSNEQLKEEGGVLGALGTVAAFVSAENSRYYVEAEVDVESAGLDPSDKVEIQMV